MFVGSGIPARVWDGNMVWGIANGGGSSGRRKNGFSRSPIEPFFYSTYCSALDIVHGPSHCFSHWDWLLRYQFIRFHFWMCNAAQGDHPLVIKPFVRLLPMPVSVQSQRLTLSMNLISRLVHHGLVPHQDSGY
ncbi:hypothetical protein WG66_012972 [Moniliophthora roreri]|nr:hypothetical protein WG66_012972 [Moniliophthora roreri]